MSYASQTGAVLFARRLDQVAAFYSNVLGLSETNRDDDHIRLESPTFLLVVHRIAGPPAQIGDPGESPVRCAKAAFKPVFFVESLARTRVLATTLGGAMEPAEKEWSYNGVLICDALDPEGNVIQFREIA